MGSKTYDRMKFIALVVLPALSAAYFTLGQIWNLPYVEQIVGTVTVVDTFLGAILAKSSKDFREQLSNNQFMGHLTIVQDVDGQPLQIRMDPKDDYPVFEDGKTAQFLVRREPLK